VTAARSPGVDARYLRLVAVAALVGIPAALVAALLLALVHELEHRLWPHDPAWYVVVGLPVAGAAIVLAARTWLPGDGGEPPLHGLSSAPTPLAHVPGIALAAIGTLSFGAVLGPEAPVIALGSAAGVAVARLLRADAKGTAAPAAAGSMSAISALFGGPLVAGIMMMEGGVGLGWALLKALLPGLVAAAIGYVLFVGLGDWGGLSTQGLAIPQLPPYHGTHVLDLLFAIAVGAGTALLLAAIRRVASRPPRLPLPALLLGGGLAVGLLAEVAGLLGADTQDVLFSGQAAEPDLVMATSAKIVLVLLAAKAIAYAISLGCGFRGGPIFPAVFLGTAVASLGTVWLGTSPTLAVAVGAAAGMAAQARLVVAPLLFALLLAGRPALDAAPASVLAVAAAWIAAAALNRE
jgi:H+/Cl- antiporter ClcA